MLNHDPNWNPRGMDMEILFIMSGLLCGNQEPLMKPLMKTLNVWKLLMKPCFAAMRSYS